VPARALLAYLPELVQHDRPASANFLLAVSMQTSMVAGPALGTGLGRPRLRPTALRLDGLTFLLAVTATLPLPEHAPAPTTSSPLAESRRGLPHTSAQVALAAMPPAGRARAAHTGDLLGLEMLRACASRAKVKELAP
jgi:predicted MFS family arabinose efflux permease